jgi:multidrug efflux pump subunit AcrA (membrane-fusion protein)
MTSVAKLFVEEGQEVKKGELLIKFVDSAAFRAPFNGTITEVNHKDFETIIPNTVVLSMMDLKNKYIEVPLEQEGALKVEKGQSVVIIFESLKNRKFKGQVVSLYPKQNEILAHINVEKLPRNILPGMTADLSIEVSRRKNVMLIPVNALANGQVVIKRGKKKQKISIETGNVNGKYIEITKGDIREKDLIQVKDK